MQLQQLTGMAVVSMREADRLGTISEVLLATEPLRIAALRATGERGDVTIPFDDVRSVGRDAITVDTSGVAINEFAGSSSRELLPMTALHELKVVDESGTYLGTVGPVDIDERGNVVAFEAHRGGVLGLGGQSRRIEAPDVLSVGSEVLTTRSI